MLDFTSALYLGLHHPFTSLRNWSSFTTGKPAALVEPVGVLEVAQALADLVGCEQALLFPSTLHAFWDLFTILADDRAALHVDDGAYAIARWGAEHAASRGARVRLFPHHDANAVARQLSRRPSRAGPPVVVADGLCPRCGRVAPVRDYLDLVRPLGGYLVLDDTQALGILGQRVAEGAPYGIGGGGTLRFSGANNDSVVVASSLAKGFGVPVAVLAGSDAFIRRVERRSDVRVHCSPPSMAVVRAAEHALAVNDEQGDALRERLARVVERLVRGLVELGLRGSRSLFPVQTLARVTDRGARILHARLLASGVRAVLHGDHGGRQARLSFLMTAEHAMHDVDCALDTLRRAFQPNQHRTLGPARS